MKCDLAARAAETKSEDEAYRMAAYSRFANSYVRKPVAYDRFAAAARDLGLYWLVLNRPVPRKNG